MNIIKAVRKEVDLNTIVVSAWGIALMADGTLCRAFGGGFDIFEKDVVTLQTAKVLPGHLHSVEEELWAVASDRYAEWPTVEKYLTLLRAA